MTIIHRNGKKRVAPTAPLLDRAREIAALQHSTLFRKSLIHAAWWVSGVADAI